MKRFCQVMCSRICRGVPRGKDTLLYIYIYIYIYIYCINYCKFRCLLTSSSVSRFQKGIGGMAKCIPNVIRGVTHGQRSYPGGHGALPWGVSLSPASMPALAGHG